MNTPEIDWPVKDCPSNARQYMRDHVAIEAQIRIQIGGRNKVKVIDLSQSGFRMECMTYIPYDRTVFLTIPDFSQMEARIAWQTEWLYGCEFTRPLYPAIYDHIVKKHPELASKRTQAT